MQLDSNRMCLKTVIFIHVTVGLWYICYVSIVCTCAGQRVQRCDMHFLSCWIKKWWGPAGDSLVGVSASSFFAGLTTLVEWQERQPICEKPTPIIPKGSPLRHLYLVAPETKAVWTKNESVCVCVCCCVAADRVKQIKTDARINNVQTDKLIAALIAEKEKLLRDLDAASRSGTPTDGFTNDGEWLFTVITRHY